MSVYKTKEFKALQADWYRKLKQTGFNDIEAHERSEYEVNDVELRRIKGLAGDPSRAEWHRCVARFAESNMFERKLHQAIYRLHAEDRTNQEVYEILRNDPIYAGEILPRTVERVVRKYNRRLKALIKAGTLDKALDASETA